MTTTQQQPPHADPGPDLRPGSSPGRGWAVAGAVAGLAGVVGIQASLAVDAVYHPDYAGDAERIAERLDAFVPHLLVMHVAMTASSLLLLVLAAGLRRRLQDRVPAGSLLPEVAAGGLMLTSVAALMGVAFTTEIVFGLTQDVDLDPEFAAVVGHWIATVPWLWVGAGVTGLAVAVAARRHDAAPRWLGRVAAVLGAITVLSGISPLQYLAGFTGPVLVLLLGAGFALADRSGRQTDA